jgi:hypothetical protein
MARVYLDHAATTKPDPRGRGDVAVLRVLGRPSSVTSKGRKLGGHRCCRSYAPTWRARKDRVHRRRRVDNAAIRGAALAQRERGHGSHVVTSAIEHHAPPHRRSSSTRAFAPACPWTSETSTWQLSRSRRRRRSSGGGEQRSRRSGDCRDLADREGEESAGRRVPTRSGARAPWRSRLRSWASTCSLLRPWLYG